MIMKDDRAETLAKLADYLLQPEQNQLDQRQRLTVLADALERISGHLDLVYVTAKLAPDAEKIRNMAILYADVWALELHRAARDLRKLAED